MLARLRPLALVALLAPTATLAQIEAPGTIALCADLKMEVSAKPKGREQMTVTLRVTNTGPGDFQGKRGDAWVEHVVTVGGQEVERKKQGFAAIPSGGKKEFTFTRNKSDGDFGVWALIDFSAGFKAQKSANGDCDTSDNGAVAPVSF